MHEPQGVRLRGRGGISPGAVLIGASHSHSAGPIGMVRPGQYDHARAFVRRLAYEMSKCDEARQVARVREAIVAAVCEAHASRAPARCGASFGLEDKVAFNRRLWRRRSDHRQRAA